MTLTEMFLIAFPRYDVKFVNIIPVIHNRGVNFTVSCPSDAMLKDIEVKFFKYGDVWCSQQINMQSLILLHQLLRQRGFLPS